MWLLIPILIYSLLYLYVRHVYTYWKRKGFPTERTGLSWRFIKQVYKREFQYVNALTEAYSAGRREFLGIYFFFRPTLLVRDVNLARCILDNSYAHFQNTKWDYVKNYRKINLLEKLAPIFTTHRIEGMFRNIEKVADYMVQHLKTSLGELETVNVDMQHMLRIYSINIIGNLIYGLDSNNFEHSDCLFTNYVSKSVGSSYTLNSFTLNHLPKKSSLTYRLRDIIKESVESRENGGCIRKDVMQLLVKFRNVNDIGNGAKQNWHIENIFAREKALSIKKLSKVAEVFLNMGLETMASAIVLTLYELLQEPAILEKLLHEIKNIKPTLNDGKQQLSFADINNLKYLNACIQETLRKYPGVPIIERVCRKNFNIPDSRHTISEGRTIMIPIISIQRDEKYFDEPMKYKPERFLQQDAAKAAADFVGYGLGAGTCIAQNFSKLVIKMALVKLLLNFNMELLQNKKLEIVYNPAPIIKSRDGFKVKLKNQAIKPSFYL